MTLNQVRGAGVLAVVMILAAAGGAAAVPAHTPIEGTGSSWAANLVNQWVADVAQQGMQVVYTPTGSAVGRRDFSYQTNDFAVSDIPFQGRDPLTGEEDTNRGRPFAYLPIAAGGTSFPYQIRVGGQLVRDLRLSGETLAKIFTNVITDWSDPQITADNNGRQLPSKPIIPVVHSEGSGATFQFTRYLAKQFTGIWSDWSGSAVPTEYYPATKPGARSNIIPQDRSEGVMNFIASTAGDGAIGYNEYSYALAVGFPVAKIKNENGYFTLPTDYNVAVSLTSALINADPNSSEYLTQNLDRVYVQRDNRTYPLSSYSYLILPIGNASNGEQRLTSAKRQTLADFLSYAVCQGQRAAGPLGYAPLPINLVQASFDQIGKLRDADPAVVIDPQPIDHCNNPTFVPGDPNRNYLAEIAPMPPECDRVGNGPCGIRVSPVEADVPIEAANNTPPYAGSLVLQVAVGASVHMSQIDPSTPAGHPPMSTDPTGHRHAWVFTGNLTGISIVDTRPDPGGGNGIGWTLNGQAASFVNGPTSYPASYLGWAPVLVAAGSDAEGTVTAGAIVDSMLKTATSDGLLTSKILASAAAGNGLGTQNVGSGFELRIPDTSLLGTYASTLTVTLISP